MSMTTPIVDFVRRYAQSGTSRLHMPGHKGQSLLGFEPWDITEIKGADELYGADGIIAQSEANATRLFGTVHTYYSTEGSSQCIRAMLCLALQAAPAAGQRPVLLAARNAHKALLYAAALLDFDIQWLWPAPQDAGALCSCPVSAAKLTGALQDLAQQGKRPFGVYITSPDYLGGVQDIAALADGGIEQKLQTLNGVRSTAVLEKLVTVEGELVFAKPPAAILDITGSAAVREVKLLAGKAVVKGEVRAQCAWRAEGESSLQSQAASLPFNQVVDLEGVAEDCRCMCVLEPVAFALAEGEQEASGQLTASVMMHLHAWRPCQLQYVADAFSTQFETAVTPQELAAEDLACMLNETASSTASGPLPDADAQLRACFVSYGPAQVTPYRDGWAFTVRAVATAFAENSLAELESYEKTLELVFPLAVEAPPGAQFSPECWLSTENIQCSCTGGTLEVTVTARAEGAILCRSTHPGIGSIELGEPLTTPDPEIALRIYYAQAGEELFGIARRFHVSPAQILTANGLEAGTQVLPQAMHFLVPGA